MSDVHQHVVLFLCTGNSARSQMAEALLRQMDSDGRFQVHSAGLVPKLQVHPMAIRALQEVGANVDGLHPKSSGQFLGKVAVRYAIIVCSNAQSHCPRIYPFAAKTLYWPFEDPAEFVDDDEATLAKFRAVRDQIAQRLQRWLETEVD